MIQQDLSAADLDDQILRDQRNVASIKVFAQLTIGQPECGGPDSDNIFLGERGGGHALPIDKCSVVTAQVDNLVLSVARFAQFGMAPRDTEIGKDEVIVRRPADTQPAGGQWQHRGGPPVHAQPVVLLRLDAPAAAPAAAPVGAIAGRAAVATRAPVGAIAGRAAVATRAPVGAIAGRAAVATRAPVGAIAGRAAVATRGAVATRAAVAARAGDTPAGNVLIRNVRARSTPDERARGTRGGRAALPAADVAAGLVLNCSVVQHGGAGLAVEGERAGAGRRYLGGRVHGAGGRFTAQHRAILRITEPDHAIGTDGDPVHTASPDKCPVCASGILKYPCVLFVPERRMTPRHA